MSDYDTEVRMKAAELSAMVTSRVALALMTREHIDNHLIRPLALAPLFESYIRTGKIDEVNIQIYSLVQ